jgi:hypothetical protein
VAFLPAPNTWIEWLEEDKKRRAVSLQEKTFDWKGKATKCIKMTSFTQELDGSFAAGGAGGINTETGERFVFRFEDSLDYIAEKSRSFAQHATGMACIFLAIINSPRIIGQRKHAPHKGLMRDLARSSVNLGKVHDWTEILLEVTKPRDIYDGEEHSDVITGRRALHFCRRHIRILSSGRLTYVTAHWRGDPALGTRQSTYAVAP